MTRIPLFTAPKRESVVLNAFSQMLNFVGFWLGQFACLLFIPWTLFALYCNLHLYFDPRSFYSRFIRLAPSFHVWEFNNYPLFHYALLITSLLVAGYMLLHLVVPASRLSKKLPLLQQSVIQTCIWGYSAYLAFFLLLGLNDVRLHSTWTIPDMLRALPYVPQNFELFLCIVIMVYLFVYLSSLAVGRVSDGAPIQIDIHT